MADAAHLGLPFSRRWWIDPGRIVGGRYPGTQKADESARMLGQLLDAGVSLIVNLQEPAERGRNDEPFADYEADWVRLGAERNVDTQVLRFPIKDWTAPTAERMSAILAAMEFAVDAGCRVYVHCWGGHGRTGTVAGCWLVRRGLTPAAAMETIRRARHHDPHLAQQRSPQSGDQLAMVRGWPDKRVS